MPTSKTKAATPTRRRVAKRVRLAASKARSKPTTQPPPTKPERRYWLMKTEPDVFGIDDLQRDGRTVWEGVRNYQARNHIRGMKAGDVALIYHSSCAVTGLAGIGTIADAPRPDESALDPASDYFDPQSRRESPRWFAVDVVFVSKFATVLTPKHLRSEPRLQRMVLFKNPRLSIQPVTRDEFERIMELAQIQSA